MVYLTEKEEWLTRMEISIKESGRMEKLMVMEFLLIQMDPCILVYGRMINSMEKELSLGTIIKSNLLASLKMVKKQEMANLNLLEDITMVILLMDSFMEMENIIFQKQKSFMKVNLKTIIWKEKELWRGQINQNMKENLKTGKLREEGQKYFKMEIGISDNGKMIYNMEVESIIVWKTRQRDKENGKMERDTAG